MRPDNSRMKALRTLYGIFIVVGIAISWVGSTQFAKSTYTSSFDAPWFVVWFSTIWMSLCFPVISLCYRLIKGWGFRTSFTKAQNVFGDRGLCPITLLTRCLPFVIIWCGCNYMYTRSLYVLSATDVTALFSSTPAFVFVLSLLLLKDELFSWRRLLATLISIGGIVVIAYSNGFTGTTMIGVLLAVGSAVLAAMYKVTFKLFIGNGAALGLAFNFLINFGIAFTFPLFISLGTVLGIPLNAAVDAAWRAAPFSWLKGTGAVMIIVGFILMSFRTKDEGSEEDSSTPQMSSALFVHNTKKQLLESS
ncbi:Hypothetical predicted protein [Paramuricea clavata]|uniref:Uncharacterized protein n=1 Tax=Paramuricea clavata TaxID=317549 RepID=A0A7D9H7H0_PARCT|nr:Hypothetical predicted protein [Paramuricea clavata]